MKKLFLCLLLSLFSPILATASDELGQQLQDEMQRLRRLSQNLELHLPERAQKKTAERPMLEDSISVRAAAPVRANQLSSEQRPLQQADFALEALSLDELENPPTPTRPLNKRRVRSR
jgi:hypothetical protein